MKDEGKRKSLNVPNPRCRTSRIGRPSEADAGFHSSLSFHPSSFILHPSSFRGFSFLEVLISLVILLAGILAILIYFPNILRANDRAIVLSEAALLAQRKAEEIRRDDNLARTLISEIRNLTTPTSPVVFVENPNLAYRFSGVSLLHPVEAPGDPASQRGVARVIIQYAPGFRSANRPVYELRFDE